MYEKVIDDFLSHSLDKVDDVYFVIGNSIKAGTIEWKNRRKREDEKQKKYIKEIRNGNMPQSLGTPFAPGRHGRGRMKLVLPITLSVLLLPYYYLCLDMKIL